jgi:predicted nucleic acid-binding protein
MIKRLVLDAGPLIGLFYAKDTYHAQCTAGFKPLIESKVILLTPVPIIFEVYKWLLQRTQPYIAQQALQVMNESLHMLMLESDDFQTVQEMILQLPRWQGSLEDATVVFTALRYRCPVWTYNFRDFSAFKALEFWTP